MKEELEDVIQYYKDRHNGWAAVAGKTDSPALREEYMTKALWHLIVANRLQAVLEDL
jgi:hypothetical protein